MQEKKIEIKNKKVLVFIASGGTLMLKDFIFNFNCNSENKKKFFGKIEKDFWKN